MKRVLVGHDLSQASERALLRALWLASKQDASVRIVHCTDGSAELAERASARRELLSEAQVMAEEVGCPSLDISVRLTSGDPGKEILAEAESFDADLIILGGHGEPSFRDVVAGTTATYVVRHGDRPVLIAQDVNRASYTDIMIAIDDPLDAERLLTSTLAIAPAAKLLAIHAYSPTLVQLFVGSDELEFQQGRISRQIKSAVAEVLEGAKATELADRIEVKVETGDVLEVLMKAYEARQPSLLVMGTRARSSFLGSHAVDSLFSCPGDVLVIPDRARAIAPASRLVNPVPSKG